MERAQRYDALAKLLSYPGPEHRETLSSLGAALAGDPADVRAARLVLAFDRETSGRSLEELEELYTRTFDLNPDASLETGWQLFGETYERGAYLVKMRALLRSCGIEESGELPDHLSYLLMAVGRLSDEEAGSVSASYLRKSVGKMIAAFADDTNPYLKLLQAAAIVIEGTTPAKREGQQ